MFQGTTSWAGKSLLTTAGARMCARASLSVAPFKAQNMSNNARVVDGGEIGSAQWLQGRAGGGAPAGRVKPVPGKTAGDPRRARRAHDPGPGQARGRRAQPGRRPRTTGPRPQPRAVAGAATRAVA